MADVASTNPTRNPAVCVYWLSGRCTRNPCKFLHPRTPLNYALESDNKNRSNCKSAQEAICQYWASGNCRYGDRCRFLHSWFRSKNSDFSMLTRLRGHKKTVTGIAMVGDRLVTAAKDGTIRVWDCNSGLCTRVISLGLEIGCLIVEGSWVFVGLPNAVKAWYLESNLDSFDTSKVIFLDGPVSGKVYAMITNNCDMLFGASHGGSILAWRATANNNKCCNPFDFVASLKGHTKPVVCLAVGAEGTRLYSGSMDFKIKVWNIQKMELIETLEGHSDVVMSVICSQRHLLSCSLDGTVKVWEASEGAGLKVTNTHEEEVGVLAVHGMMDMGFKPVLLCSCNDDTVRLYDLPSFTERGKIFGKREVRFIQNGSQGLFFTGDATGVVSVWRWSVKPCGLPS